MFRRGHFTVSDVHQKHVNAQGMHWFMASVFVMAEMVGAGIVVLPVALAQAGSLPGVCLLVLGAFFSGFTGIQLAHNWTIMQKRWTEYQEHCRRPYPEMAYRALGAKAKYAMDVCLAFTLYGVVTVFLLFSATNISILLEDLFSFRVDYCIFILIVAVIVWPFTLLKSPMHFWQAGVLATLASALAAALIIFGTAHDAATCHQHANYPDFSWGNLFLAYGTMVFSYGGHSAFPTIQCDMKRPADFTRSIVLSYIFILVVYLAISFPGYIVYGDSVHDSIIPSLQLKWVAIVVNVLITLHVMPAIILIFSPLAQLVDELLKIDHDFGSKRVLSRTSVYCLCVFTALSVPKFGLILDLVGSSTVTLMTMILPSVFWLYLNTIDKLGKTEKPSVSEILKNTPKWLLLLNCVSLLFALIGGIAATVTAISHLFSAEMAAPCYVHWFREEETNGSSILGASHCCGKYRNITVGDVAPEGFCSL